jgi:cytochrome bd-type quinol oxidase subunit 2
MSAWVVQVAVVALFALTCGALAAAWMRGRLGMAALCVLLVAVVVWAGVFIAIGAEFGDANSFATCESECSAAHYAWAVAFIAPPLLIALAALAMLIVRGTMWRSRRSSARENHA